MLRTSTAVYDLSTTYSILHSSYIPSVHTGWKSRRELRGHKKRICKGTAHWTSRLLIYVHHLSAMRCANCVVLVCMCIMCRTLCRSHEGTTACAALLVHNHLALVLAPALTRSRAGTEASREEELMRAEGRRGEERGGEGRRGEERGGEGRKGEETRRRQGGDKEERRWSCRTKGRRNISPLPFPPATRPPAGSDANQLHQT